MIPFIAGICSERQAQRDEVARIAAAGTQPANRAFQIAHLRKLRPKIVQAGGIFDERLHRFLPPANRLDGGERLRKPVAQAPRAHGRDRAIERAVKRSVARRVVVQRLQNFQMPQRGVIEREKIVALIKRKPREVLHVAPQVLREVMQRAPAAPMAAVRSFNPNPSSEATLKCSRTVNSAVSGANVQSS